MIWVKSVDEESQTVNNAGRGLPGGARGGGAGTTYGGRGSGNDGTAGADGRWSQPLAMVATPT